MIIPNDIFEEAPTNYDRIPATLLSMSQWVLWKLEKGSKVPYSVNGTMAKSNDPATWASPKAVAEVYRRGGYTGIGFMFNGAHCGVDFDHCLDTDGKFLDPAIKKEVRTLADAGGWVERSFSGDGVHVIGLYSGSGLTGKKKDNREAYTQSRYFAITGSPVPGVPAGNTMADITEAFTLWHSKHFTTTVKGAAADQKPIVELDLEQNVEWFKEFLTTAPPAVEFKGSDGYITKTIFPTAKDHGISRDKAIDLVMDIFIPRCEGRFDVEWVTKKAQNAYRYATQTAPGSATPQSDFGSDSIPAGNHIEGNGAAHGDDTKGPIEPWLKELNEEFFVANDQGNVQVFCEIKNPGVTDPLLVSYSFEDFKKLYKNKYASAWHEKEGRWKKTDIGTAWIDHPNRRQFLRGLVFDPQGNEQPDQYNTWRGWAVTPKEGKHPQMTNHLLNVICAGNQEHFYFLMGALATMFQFPGRPWMIILAIKGRQGCGKGFGFTDQLQKMFGPSAIHLHNSNDLTGDFNGHLRHKSLVIANEAFFAGDRKHHALLKGLATDPTFLFTAKYKNPVQDKNVAHLILTSNEEWVLPADFDDRRAFMLEASSEHVGDKAYFDALGKELTHGGLEALLYTFLAYDLDLFDFNVTAMPKTVALAEQKAHNLRGPYKWIYDCLSTGEIGDLYKLSYGEATTISKKAVSAEYGKPTKKERYADHAGPLGKALKKTLAGTIEDTRPGADGREWVWHFKPLPQLRNAFDEYLGQPVKWDD